MVTAVRPEKLGGCLGSNKISGDVWQIRLVERVKEIWVVQCREEKNVNQVSDISRLMNVLFHLETV